jgi:predicted enzyme related to lactoylglutathione lyase
VVRPTSVTVGIPVRDLGLAGAWYNAVLDRPPELEPVEGIVEYEFGGVWIQLMSGKRGSYGWVLRYGVDDLHVERERLRGLGVAVGVIETVPGVIAFFDFLDPDGNQLSCYHVLDAT